MSCNVWCNLVWSLVAFSAQVAHLSMLPPLPWQRLAVQFGRWLGTVVTIKASSPNCPGSVCVCPACPAPTCHCACNDGFTWSLLVAALLLAFGLGLSLGLGLLCCCRGGTGASGSEELERQQVQRELRLLRKKA